MGEKIGSILEEVYQVVVKRKEEPLEGSYTNYLFDQGIDKICKKIGEEATEVVIAAKNDSKPDTVYEASDLLYHLTVLLVNQGITYDDIYEELKKRR